MYVDNWFVATNQLNYSRRIAMLGEGEQLKELL
jgi:hypothetical protein